MKIEHSSLIGTFEQKREQIRKFNLMDDDFFSVVMQDKEAFEVVLRILTGRDDLHVLEVARSLPCEISWSIRQRWTDLQKTANISCTT